MLFLRKSRTTRLAETSSARRGGRMRHVRMFIEYIIRIIHNSRHSHIIRGFASYLLKPKMWKNRRFISTPRLNALPHLHLEPINPVISREPMKPNLGDSFALRCFQRLSKPKIATRRCPWWNSRYTRAPSFPVLSY